MPNLLRTAMLLGACACAMPAATAAWLPPRAQAELTLEAQFIVELAGVVRFPRAKEPGQPFVLAVIGASPFRDEIESYAAGRTVRGRPIRIRNLRYPPEGQNCDLLFICRSEWPRARSILDWSRSKGMLTVAEGQELAPLGVMVNLMVDGGYLRLGLNQRALEGEGLSIDSRVLRVARILVPGHPQAEAP